MALEPAVRELDGHRYMYAPLGSKAGMRLFAQLVQRLGDSIGQLVTAAAAPGETEADFAGKADIAGKAVGAVCARLDPDFLEELVALMANQTQVELPAEGGPTLLPLSNKIEAHFQQRIMTQFKWLHFCLGTQYSDFLDSATTALGSEGLLVKKGG